MEVTVELALTGRGPMLRVLAFAYLAVAVVPTHVEQSVGHRVFDSADLFVGVGTVRKFAAVDKGADVSEHARDLCWDYIPQLKLTDARCVDDVTTSIKRNQFGRRGCVPALIVFTTDVSDTKRKSRLDRVQNRGLAHATLSRDDAVLSRHDLFQQVHPLSRFGRNQNDRIAQLSPYADARLQVGWRNKVDFVDHNDGLNIGSLDRHQHPIDQIRLESRLCCAGDDQALLYVGGDDLLAIAAGTADCIRTRFDSYDNGLVVRLAFRLVRFFIAVLGAWFIVVADLNRHIVASDDNVLQIG